MTTRATILTGILALAGLAATAPEADAQAINYGYTRTFANGYSAPTFGYANPYFGGYNNFYQAGYANQFFGGYNPYFAGYNPYANFGNYSYNYQYNYSYGFPGYTGGVRYPGYWGSGWRPVSPSYWLR